MWDRDGWVSRGVAQTVQVQVARIVEAQQGFGGTLHLADFDAPSTPRKGTALRATSHLFGPDSAKAHLDGTWLNLIEQAGFARVHRVKTCSEILGQVAIVRARRS